ncbi:HrpB1 family type III secretion system apparatus protein [Paraburkholderia sp. CI3]|uniref:HrpB1 family type III secretion system apparatus protein n=1 Tax=Paraburkholderia sp. CI3 TaxID=2991060 RepID=UPI003D25C678
MNYLDYPKALIPALIEVVSIGCQRNYDQDAEAVLNALRVLRPDFPELETFEAWLQIRRGRWAEAIHVLRSLDMASAKWSYGKALLAYCLYMTGDSGWRVAAHEVLELNNNAEAVGLARAMLGLAGSNAAAEPADSAASTAGIEQTSAQYLRA